MRYNQTIDVIVDDLLYAITATGYDPVLVTKFLMIIEDNISSTQIEPDLKELVAYAKGKLDLNFTDTFSASIAPVKWPPCIP